MFKKLTTEKFIEQARKIHGDKYDYSKSNYTGYNEIIIITCPIHGDFEQIAGNHLKGSNCPKCIGHYQCNAEEFIEQARKVHGDKYDYSKTEYINSKTKVCIICPKHGEFKQFPKHHLNGSGCPKCKGFNKTTEEFIEQARKVHGDKYDYSKTEYENATTKVCIICPEHGLFWQKPNMHLQGQNCPKCKGFNKTTEEFIEQARKVHGDKYDYSKTIYRGSHKKIIITCPIHGDFEQIAKEHLKYGCKFCNRDSSIRRFLNKKLTTEEFIKRSIKIHGNKYDYSKVNYISNEEEVIIICPEHGEFKQTPHSHLHGHGCQMCINEKNVNENKLYDLLKMYLPYDNIIYQHKFDWLRYKLPMSVDFYLPDYNISIEYQGAQHFKCIDWFGGEKTFEDILKRDKLKIKLCNDNGIKLLHFTFYKKDIPEKFKEYNVITDINELIKMIKNEKL